VPPSSPLFHICVDNLDTGSLQNIEHLHNSDGFLFANHDVTALLHR
jgi:hypothetical protein